MIMVFGKTGQVARELQKFDEVLTIDRLTADLSDPMICMNLITQLRPTSVINAAAYTNVDKAEEEEELANLINGDSPGAMAVSCAKLSIPFIHISTDYVFDGSGELAWKTFDPANPQNAYGRSKLKGEQAVKASGAAYVILRTSWVVSSYGSNFVRTMFNLSKTQKSFNVVDDQVGGPTVANDIAKACINIAHQVTANPSKSGIYHLSGTPDVSWCEFANFIFEKIGNAAIAKPIASAMYPTKALRPLNSRLDCSSTQRTFKLTRPNWQEGLQEILQSLELEHEAT